MRTVDLRWLGGILLAALFAGGGMYALRQYQLPRIASGFMREARLAQAGNRHSDAVRNLRNYVSLVPDDADALSLYGSELADSLQFEPAYFILEKALRLDPERSDTRRKLVMLGLQLGRYQDVRLNLEVLLREFPEDGELWAWLGACLAAQSEIEQARETFANAIKFAPDRLDTYGMLASLLLNNSKQFAEAAACMDQMVANNPENYQAYLNRAEWRLQFVTSADISVMASDSRGRPIAAKEHTQAVKADVARARELVPDAVDVLALAVRLAIAEQSLDEARALALEGLRLHPTDSRFYLGLADVQLAAATPAAALDVLKQGVAALPSDPQLQWNLANLAIELGFDAEASAAVEQLRIAGHSSGMVGYLEGRILMQQGHWLDAIQRFEAIRPLLQPQLDLVQRADFLLGKAYGEIDAHDQQLTCLRRAVSLNPQWIPARMALAESLLAANFERQAAEEYRKILALPGAPAAAGLELARCLRHLIARLPADAQDWKEFDEILLQVEQQIPRSAQVSILRAEKLVSQGDDQAASELIAAAKEAAPEELDLWLVQIALKLQTAEWQTVEEMLQAAEQRFGDQVILRMVQADYLMRRFHLEAGDPLKAISRPSPDWSTQEQFVFLQKMALMFLSINDYAESERIGLAGAALQPGNLSIRVLLFDVALRAHRPQLMKQVLNEVRAISGEGPLWHYGEAVRCTLAAQSRDQAKHLQRARLLLAQAQGQRPGWPQIPLLKAKIEMQLADKDDAIDHLLEAISLGERTPAVLNLAVTLLSAQRRFVEADQVVRRLQDREDFLTGDLLRSASEIAIQLKDPSRAIDMAEELVRQTDSVSSRVWLAQVLGTLGRMSEAEEILRRLLTAEASHPEPWIALVQLLANAKQFDQAAQVIAEAEQAINSDESALIIAQCFELTHQLELAAAKFQLALDQAPEDAMVLRRVVEFQFRHDRSREAEPLLRRILNGSPEPGDRRWAARNLALALAISDDAGRLDEAEKLIDGNLAADSLSSADQRVKAMILSRRPTLEDRRQAIAILQTLVSHELNDDPEDRYLLAKLYLSTGDRIKARSEFRKLLVVDNHDARFISEYIQMLLQDRELSDAELWLSRLKDAGADDFLIINFQAQVLLARERYEELADFIKSVAQKPSSTDDAANPPHLRTLWAAEKLEEISAKLEQRKEIDAAARLVSDAETLYVKYVQQRPEDSLVLAEFCARRGQIERSLDLLALHGKESSPYHIAAVCIAVMRNPQSEAVQLERLQTYLTSILDSRSSLPSLSIVQADLMSWRGAYDQAVQMYQLALQNDPKNVFAMNNLALVLAVSGQNHPEALRLVQRALDGGGEEAVLLDTRGMIYLAMGSPAKALADFEVSLSSGESSERFFHVAVAQADLRQTEAAKKALAKALELGLTEASLHPLERPILAKTRALLGI